MACMLAALGAPSLRAQSTLQFGTFTSSSQALTSSSGSRLSGSVGGQATGQMSSSTSQVVAGSAPNAAPLVTGAAAPQASGSGGGCSALADPGAGGPLWVVLLYWFLRLGRSSARGVARSREVVA